MNKIVAVFLFLLLAGACGSNKYISYNTHKDESGRQIAVIVTREDKPSIEIPEFENLMEENGFSVRKNFFTPKFYEDKIHEKLLDQKDFSLVEKYKLHYYLDKVAYFQIRLKEEKPPAYMKDPYFSRCTVLLRLIDLDPVKLTNKIEITDIGGGFSIQEANNSAIFSCIQKARKMLPFEFNPKTNEPDPKK